MILVLWIDPLKVQLFRKAQIFGGSCMNLNVELKRSDSFCVI